MIHNITSCGDIIGFVVLMGTRSSKIRTLFLEGNDEVDPAMLPEELQMLYVSKPELYMDYYGIVGTRKPSPEDFSGTVILKKTSIPENGILFNFNPYVLLNRIKEIKEIVDRGEDEDLDENKETLKDFRLIAQAYGYLDIKPEELQEYEVPNEPFLSVTEFMETL